MPHSSPLLPLSPFFSRPSSSNYGSDRNKVNSHWAECDELPDQWSDRLWGGVQRWRMRDLGKVRRWMLVCMCFVWLKETPNGPLQQPRTDSWVGWLAHGQQVPCPPSSSLSSLSSVMMMCWALGQLLLHDQVDAALSRYLQQIKNLHTASLGFQILKRITHLSSTIRLRLVFKHNCHAGGMQLYALTLTILS